MRVTVLGCGGSGGVPLSTGQWGTCDPANPRNRRRRASILVEAADRTILVDTSPDLREQLLDAACNRIDAVVFTHAHADHCHGIDDLRPVNALMGRPIDAYGIDVELERIRTKFEYAFNLAPAGQGIFKPQLVPRPVDAPFAVGQLEIVPFVQDHHVCQSLGMRIGRFAYSTDVVRLDDHAFDVLKGVDTWIVGCLRVEPHPTHAHLARVLEWADRVGPRRLVLTHMNHQLDYRAACGLLPAGAEPGHDGLVLEVP